LCDDDLRDISGLYTVDEYMMMMRDFNLRYNYEAQRSVDEVADFFANVDDDTSESGDESGDEHDSEDSDDESSISLV
jgi:hypothetical protein